MNRNNIAVGFNYRFDIFREGRLISSDEVHNLVPTQGLNTFMGMLFNGIAVPSTWFVGIYGSNYEPVAPDTMATFPTAAGEISAYSSATRVPYVPGSAVAGVVSNSASPAAFTMTDAGTVYGGFISSATAKNSTSGALVSAAKITPSRPYILGDIVLITADFTMAPGD